LACCQQRGKASQPLYQVLGRRQGKAPSPGQGDDLLRVLSRTPGWRCCAADPGRAPAVSLAPGPQSALSTRIPRKSAFSVFAGSLSANLVRCQGQMGPLCGAWLVQHQAPVCCVYWWAWPHHWQRRVSDSVSAPRVRRTPSVAAPALSCRGDDPRARLDKCPDLRYHTVSIAQPGRHLSRPGGERGPDRETTQRDHRS
jgi:hypothetical protein